MSESTSQQAVIQWFGYACHQLGVPDARLLYAIPNGAFYGNDRRASIIRSARMKREGLLPGVPDLFLAVARNHYHGLYVEMKKGKGRTSPAQVEVHTMLIKQGYACATAHSTDEAMSIISGYCTER